MFSSHPLKTTTFRGRFCLILLALLLAPLLNAQENADNTTGTEPIIDLNPFVVRFQSTLLGDALEKAIVHHGSIAGGTNLIVPEDLGLRRTLTLKDTLELEPGIIIQDFFGSNDQPRIFIRGSGIQSNPQRRGISLLQNGIPLNFSDGSFLISALDIKTARFIEVYRGSNALKYGSASLGGAINVVSSKGSDINGFQIEAEGGSFGYIGGSVASGTRSANTDSFASVTYNESNGFRDHNTSSQLNAQANLLWMLNENWENGIYLSYTDADFDVPGPLTWAQLEEDSDQNNPGVNPPHSIGPNVVRDLPRRSTQITRVADRSIYRFSESNQLTTSVYFHQVDDEFIFPVGTGVQEDDWNDYGFNLELATLTDKNSLTVGTRLQWGTSDRTYSANISGAKGLTYAANELTATNLLLYLENSYRFTEGFSGIVGLQVSHNTRDNKDSFATPDHRPSWNAVKGAYVHFSSPDSSLDQDYTSFNPRVGLIYDLNETSQLFANVSCSFEPPTFDELFVCGGGTPNSGATSVTAKKLDAQEATTFEFGTRGEKGALRWDLSFYRSWIEDEILTTSDLLGVAGVTRNSPDTTIHQGIELGIGATLFENLFTENGDTLTFSGIYNYSDFYFDDGVYDGKQLAGVPKHYITADLSYTHPGGLSLGINIEWLPDDNPTDHQNTVYNPSYCVLGVRAAWKGTGWSVFIEGKNITDETYASSFLIRDIVSDPPPAALGIDNVTTYQPGTGASVIIGCSLSL